MTTTGYRKGHNSLQPFGWTNRKMVCMEYVCGADGFSVTIANLLQTSVCPYGSHCDRGKVFRAINFKLHIHTFGVWGQCSIDFQTDPTKNDPVRGGHLQKFPNFDGLTGIKARFFKQSISKFTYTLLGYGHCRSPAGRNFSYAPHNMADTKMRPGSERLIRYVPQHGITIFYAHKQI